MTNVLDRIKAYKLTEITARKQAVSLTDMEARARTAAPVRGFARALADAARAGYGLIAEIKKASPSKGLIREDFQPAELARAYARGGATCLSVLTDTPSFQGADAYLGQARGVVDLPVLRKDFMFDPYQIVESRALGADCILIIMAAVSDAQAHELEATAVQWGMDVLVEVHNRAELERALRLSSPLLGINNRDLKTFVTSLETTRDLVKRVPDGKTVVSESGLFHGRDLKDMATVGVRCFLIGESLMRQRDVEAATRTILEDK